MPRKIFLPFLGASAQGEILGETLCSPASKAFERVSYAKLFIKLLSRDTSPISIRLLMSLYVLEPILQRRVESQCVSPVPCCLIGVHKNTVFHTVLDFIYLFIYFN